MPTPGRATGGRWRWPGPRSRSGRPVAGEVEEPGRTGEPKRGEAAIVGEAVLTKIAYLMYQWYHQFMSARAAAKFEFGHQFKAREARDQLKDVLDEAERGGVAVVRREKPVVLVLRDEVDRLVASRAPFEVKGAVTGGQFAFWLEDVPVHAVGADLDDAEEQFLDALVDYADLWYQELRYAPNHAGNQWLALRVAMYAGDREELRRVVFGDD